jgi:hypothetical protein
MLLTISDGFPACVLAVMNLVQENLLSLCLFFVKVYVTSRIIVLPCVTANSKDCYAVRVGGKCRSRELPEHLEPQNFNLTQLLPVGQSVFCGNS